MSNRILRYREVSDDRRTSNRLPIERDVRYKVLGAKRTLTQVGSGRTLNMSSTGILFSTESTLPEGERIQLSVSWPAQLNDTLPLKLAAVGRLVRAGETQAAISIEIYEFKTCGSNGF